MADFLAQPMLWLDLAACKDMEYEVFFPEKGKSGKLAQITCFSCTVRKECNDWKKQTGSTDGIWAGEYSQRGPATG